MASYILVNIASIHDGNNYQIVKNANILSAYLQLGKPVSVKLENGEIIRTKCLAKSNKIKHLMIMKSLLEEQHFAVAENREVAEDMVTIGPNRSLIRSSVLNSMDWLNHRHATRKLMMELFERETLATHTLTGKLSPVQKNRTKVPKPQLNVDKIADIIHIVVDNCKNVSRIDVKAVITSKCADEQKLMKKRIARLRNLHH